MDFVVGYEIRRSNSADADCDICRNLEGKYPKSFLWSGWHDGCKCQVVPVMVSDDEFNDDELFELRAALKGEEATGGGYKSTIRVLPINFISWIINMLPVFKDSGTYPDFIDNNMEIILKSLKYYGKSES